MASKSHDEYFRLEEIFLHAQILLNTPVHCLFTPSSAGAFVFRKRIRAREVPFGRLRLPRAFGAAGARLGLRLTGRSPIHSKPSTSLPDDWCQLDE